MKDAGSGTASQRLPRTRSGDLDAKLCGRLWYNLIRSIYSIEFAAAGVHNVISLTADTRQVYCNRLVFR
ncbi:MAG TPA: hypothetical protein HPP57_01890 [Deltaproteobacteria bacterium]|jgi:hypothetical protein|nr:hypothetical protein [Deltaproteobacteria bacterium]